MYMHVNFTFDSIHASIRLSPSLQAVGRGPGLLALHKVENVYRDNVENCKRKQNWKLVAYNACYV